MALDTVVDPLQSSLSGVARVLVNAGKLNAKTAEQLAKTAKERRISFVAAVLAAGPARADGEDYGLGQVRARFVGACRFIGDRRFGLGSLAGLAGLARVG